MKTKKVKKNGYMGIGVKLVLLFSVILLLALSVLGVGSYFVATDILTKTYHNTTEGMVTEVSQEVNIFLSKFESIIGIFEANPNVIDSTSTLTARGKLFDVMNSIIEAEPDVKSVYFTSYKDSKYYSPGKNIDDIPGVANEEWYVAASESEGIILSKPFIDEETGKYKVTLHKAVYNSSRSIQFGVVSIDVSLGTLGEMVSSIAIGDKGVISLISDDSIYITSKVKKDIGTKNTIKKINDAIKNDTKEVFSYKVNGENMFGIVRSIPNSTLNVVASIPTSEITDKTSKILYLISIISVLSLVTAIILVRLFTKKMSITINKLLHLMEEVKKGDLSIDIDIKSNDEFGEIARYFKETISGISKLLLNVLSISEKLSESAQSLAATAEETSASADEVSRTVEEISIGASAQAADAEEGAKIASDLSNDFKHLSDSTNNLLSSADNVNSANNDGINVVNLLKEKTVASEAANNEIEITINELNERAQNISQILDVITGISNQTNLLALNASIEAARAGEHGRGFAVVADEIRKLAEESSNSAEGIRSIVNTIQDNSKKTVESMAELKDIAKEQTNSVDLVSDAFSLISNGVNEMSEQIGSIGSMVVTLEDDKNKIVSSISNISAISEETAAASEEVNATMEQQTYAVEEVAKSAEMLNEISVHLKEELQKFKL